MGCQKKIKLLIMDIDGTLTDGKIYVGVSGELFKAFNVKDGYGICEILPLYSIIPAIITGRSSEIVVNRCRELGITELYQGIHDKKKPLLTLIEKYECSLGNVAYIGDDVLDLQCMQLIKEAGGDIGCPADAITEVKEMADFISGYGGGNGAVRDFIEWIVRS